MIPQEHTGNNIIILRLTATSSVYALIETVAQKNNMTEEEALNFVEQMREELNQ